MFRNVLLSIVLLASLVVSPPATAEAADAGPDAQSIDLDIQSVDSDAVTDRVGLVDPSTGVWFVRGQNGAVASFFYGNPGDVPFVGDWNCDGIDTPGLYRQTDGFVYLRNSNTQGPADIRFFFGNPGDFPLAGDFDNDGCDTVSIYRQSEARIYIINALGANDGGLGAADFSYIFGNPGDKPFTGDFNGDGIDTVGLHRESTGFVYFRQTHTQGVADAEFFYGDPGDRFVSGDWGVVDGIDTPAIYRPSNSAFFFRYSNTQGNAEESLGWGVSSFLPIAGNWGAVTAGGPVPDPGGPGVGGGGGPGTPLQVEINGPLPNAVVGIPYSAQLSISGGVPPLTVTKLSGPIWANVSPSGLVTGTPLLGDKGSTHLQVQVTDSSGASASAAIVLTVIEGCEGVTVVPQIQCDALKAFYNSTGGNNWTVRTDWFTNPNPCDWHGIDCVGANISLIRLNENNLVGTLPIELGNLAGLEEINLQDNALTGAIPAGLFGITTLKIVILAHNDLNGPIPAFATLPGLTRLALDSNELSGVLPVTMNGTNLPAIVELALDENNLGGAIPTEFSTLSTLTSLRLDENQFDAGLELFIQTNFPNLARLELGNNAFAAQGLPTGIGTMAGLSVLDLSGNGFTGNIPTEYFSLVALSRLELDGNALSGLITSGFHAGTYPNLAAGAPGALLLRGQTGCLTAAGAELAFVQAQDPLWNDGCP